MSKGSNRLGEEKSPYLLQHQDNPVHWFSWGDEAFQTAKEEDKPIFLSIGYSTCHWCHVMAHQSFEDQEVADYLNGHFISIKVDREERPDVDEIYMSAVHAMGQRGGMAPQYVFNARFKTIFWGHLLAEGKLPFHPTTAPPILAGGARKGVEVGPIFNCSSSGKEIRPGGG